MSPPGPELLLLLAAAARCASASFTEVPQDVTLGSGEDADLPCAFRAPGKVPTALEIQWWYRREEPGTEAEHQKATKISTVRVQGHAISHRLRLSKVTKSDEGVYECRVSDLWADATQDLSVHAVLRVTPGDTMVAEEAVSHIQNRWPPRNAVQGSGAGGQRSGRPLSPVSSTAASAVTKTDASPPPRGGAVLRGGGAGCSLAFAMDPVHCMVLLFLHKLLPFLLDH